MAIRIPARRCRALWAASFFLTAAPAAAFTFSDGSTMQCTVGGRSVPEMAVPATAQFTGRAVRGESGYRILWNSTRLEALPPVMRDFLFFHECAHAQLGTQEELAANCAGLKAMRAAGRAGLAVEARIAAFYGPTHPYWVQTLACADAAAAPPSSPGEAAPGRP